MDWIDEMGCNSPDDIERYLFALAEEYHQRTEAFDRTVCTGPILHGSIMPATPREMATINRHAAAVRRELEDRANTRCIGRSAVAKAINSYISLR